jgi:D-sedoheptulose 7-phosphate isomerase
MSSALGTDPALAERARSNEAFFAAQAEPLARLCHRMAERFASGGRLVALGPTPVARSDARHVAVEFVHPVIVGKRALPAIALTAEGGPVAEQAALVVEPGDITMGFEGGLTVRCGDDEWAFPAPSADPFVAQEVVETAYHVLWELVHVFFEHRGLLKGREARTRHDAGGSSFLYPFLGEDEHDLEAVVDDVRRSVLAKAAEIGALREQTLTENRAVLEGAAAALRARLDAGGRLLAAGNGGSATDAMDVVADLRAARRAALDLTEDTAILTALANDVGFENVFARQVIAHGRAGDALLVISTSGGSANIVAALAEARRRGLCTIAMVGYDGGRILADALADHVVVTRSEHIPRIQEAQASAYHVLVDLVGR